MKRVSLMSDPFLLISDPDAENMLVAVHNMKLRDRMPSSAVILPVLAREIASDVLSLVARASWHTKI